MLQNSLSWAKGINRRVDRFFWEDQHFSKYCFSPKILSEATIERLVEIAVLHLWSKTWEIRFKDVYVQILVLSKFETNQEVTIHEKPQEELVNWYLLFATPIHHRRVMLMSYVIQSCNIKAIGYEVKSTPKIEFSLCRDIFRGNVSCKKSSFSYGELNQMYVTESNFIQSSFRFAKSGFL